MVFCIGFKDDLAMAQKKKKTNSNGKLLEAWIPPDGSGEPVGCIVTSFTFSPVFFEEECLGRFLQLQSDASEDGPVYIIEREEKMAEIRCIAALVDAYHCKGVRSLRWDLLAARIPKAILHSKISLLYWQNRIRVIISSANLTEDGYRRNTEIYGVIDFHVGSNAPLSFLKDAIIYLKEVGGYAFPGETVASPVRERWSQFLNAVEAQSTIWLNVKSAEKKSGPRIEAVFTGPGRKDAFSQVASFWPSNVPPESAIVTSPFFDPPGATNLPAQQLWATLKKRGRASVTFNLTGELEPNGESFVLHAPEEIMSAQPVSRQDVKTEILVIETQDKENDIPSRPLHLKSYLFNGSGWLGYMIGSSNFTSKGLGLIHQSNFEANILYLVPQGPKSKDAEQLLSSVPHGNPLKKNIKLIWQPGVDDDQESPENYMVGLPGAFGQAIYKNDQHFQCVEFYFDDTPPSGWTIFKNIDSEDVLYDFRAWAKDKEPNPIIIEWHEDIPPSGFEIKWNGLEKCAWWPVNVDKATSLPPPESLKDLPLEILINILTSARPLHLVLSNWIKKKHKTDDSGFVDPFNPHNRVDTSGFLLKKTFRVTSALTGLRKKIERPVPNEDALEWRIRGPVGVYAVAKAISKEAGSPEEKAFLLAELVLELTRAVPANAPGCLPGDKVKEEIKKVIEEMGKYISECKLKKSSAIYKYVESAFKEAKA